MEAGKGQQTNRRGRRKRAAPVTPEERDSYGLAAGLPITPAQAGIETRGDALLDARFRGHDRQWDRLATRWGEEPMANPVVVEVTRGGRIESAHRGAGAVVDADGRVVLAFGDAERPVYPRSAVKALQALALVESGAADRLGLSDQEIALSCASHSGSEEHVAIARAMLAKAGYDEDVLECGAHWPLGEDEARALARSRRTPTALHNNCSGKHAGFVCLSCDMGVAPKGYVAPDHAVQREVTAAIEGMTGARLSEDMRGVDGCSIPTYAVPLIGLARGFARLGTGQGLSPIRSNAVARIRAAVAAHPLTVAGRGRFDTEVMTLLGARALTKSGAEGVFCAALPEAGLGLAVKADDGAGRAAQVMMAALIRRFGGFDDATTARLARFVSPRPTNWNGVEVGLLRPAGPLA
jgi:L-asparaginase II